MNIFRRRAVVSNLLVTCLLTSVVIAQDSSDEPQGDFEDRIEFRYAAPIIFDNKVKGNRMLSQEQLEKILNKLPKDAQDAFAKAYAQLARDEDKHTALVGKRIILLNPDEKKNVSAYSYFPIQGTVESADENRTKWLRDDVIRELPVEVKEQIKEAEKKVAEVRARVAKERAKLAEEHAEVTTSARIVIVDPEGKRREYNFNNKSLEDFEDDPKTRDALKKLNWFRFTKPATESDADNAVEKKLDLILKRLDSLEKRVNKLTDSDEEDVAYEDVLEYDVEVEYFADEKDK